MRIFSNIKWLLHICIISMVCVIIGACASTKVEETRAVLNFDYTPPEVTSGSTDITFAAVGSEFEVPFGEKAVPMFQRFIRNMAADFGEIITARGYTMRGPFQTYDELTFVDKDASNLILTADVEFNTDHSAMFVSPATVLGMKTPYFKAKGPLVVACRISLVISESLTNEKMWTKSVNITPITLDINSSGYTSSIITLVDIVTLDNKVYSELGKQLEALYQEVMNRTYGYLDPREMALITKKAAELRKRKTF